MNLLFTTDIGIKACVYMAVDPEEVSILADMVRIFQAKTTTFKRPFRILSKNKIITSHAGRYGGFSLARKPYDIFIGDIIKMLEPDDALIAWMKSDKNAEMEHLKSTYHSVIEEAETSFLSTLNRYTIADLAGDPLTLKALKIEHLVQNNKI